jgi:flagellar M-ring protein FliF
MDFLAKALGQVRELFQSMTPGARITTGLLLVVVVVSLAYLFQSQSTGPDGYLMGGQPFSADELRVMEAAFGKASLSGYQVEGSRIRIPRGQNAAYMAALADAGALPASFGSYLDEALNTDGIFENKFTKEERILVAKQKELNLILRSMTGIEAASVLYARQKAKGLSKQDEVTASVNVKTIGDEPLTSRRVSQIKKLVAAAFAGLKPDHVTVTDLGSGAVYASSGEAALGDAMDDPYYKLKSNYEEDLEGKIHKLLAYVPGVQVKVHAELDKEMRRVEQRTNLDPKMVTPLRSHVRTETNMSEGGPTAGRPGLEAQGPAAGPTTLAAGRSTKTEEKSRDEETQNFVPQQQVSVEFKGLTPTRVRASIVIPSDYYREVWSEQNKPTDGSQPSPPTQQQVQDLEALVKKNIENAVLAILPLPPEGGEAVSQVTVTTLQSLTPDPIQSPSLGEQALAWTGQYGSTLAMLGVAGMSLLVLRSMVKSVPAPAAEAAPLSAAWPAATPEDETTAEASPETPGRIRPRISRGPSMKDELAEMVRDDPDGAASILRAWIANAG